MSVKIWRGWEWLDKYRDKKGERTFFDIFCGICRNKINDGEPYVSFETNRIMGIHYEEYLTRLFVKWDSHDINKELKIFICKDCMDKSRKDMNW